MNREEVRTEFIKDLETVNMDRAYGRLRKERRVGLTFAWCPGFVLRIVVWCVVSSQ